MTLAGTSAEESLATLLTVDARAACTDAPLPSSLWPSEAFFVMLAVALAAVSLVPLPVVGARAAYTDAFFGPPGGTNLGILEDGGPPGETGRAPVPDG